MNEIREESKVWRDLGWSLRGFGEREPRVWSWFEPNPVVASLLTSKRSGTVSGRSLLTVPRSFHSHILRSRVYLPWLYLGTVAGTVALHRTATR